MLIAGSPLDFSCIVASRPLFFYPQGILFFAFSRNTVQGSVPPNPEKFPAAPFSGLFGTGKASGCGLLRALRHWKSFRLRTAPGSSALESLPAADWSSPYGTGKASGCGPGDLLRRAKKPPAGRLGLNGPADSLRAAVSVIILNFSFFTLPAGRRTSRARRAHESPRIQAEPGQSHQFSWIS